MIKKLLTTIYPNHQWKFESLKINPNEYFKDIENQRKYMNELYEKFNLISLDDWLTVPKFRITQNGGQSLLKFYYKNDLEKLLTTIYPNYVWQFNYFSKAENRNLFMENLAIKLKYKSINEFKHLTRRNLIENGGEKLLAMYSNKLKRLLQSIYPDHQWNLEKMEVNSMNYFKIAKNRDQFLTELYYKLNFNHLDDWLTLSRFQFGNIHGGFSLLYLYKMDMKKLLSTCYPNYPWNFELYIKKFEPINYYNSIENQRKDMDEFFQELKLNSLDDWLKVWKYQFAKGIGRKLLTVYNYDMKKLLTTIYPNHNWKFEHMKFMPSLKCRYGRNHNYDKICGMIRNYSIRIKTDWYRLPVRMSGIQLDLLLKKFYPEEEWKKMDFLSKSKKSKQRLLFVYTQQIYSNYIVEENYRHPFLLPDKRGPPFELDIFIPAINFAMEYQGQQHYDDIPDCFGYNEIYYLMDDSKLQLCKNIGIRLIRIPFWWNEQKDSLLNEIERINA